METVHTPYGPVTVARMPGHGNCLFAALAHQMHGLPPRSSELAAAAAHLRARVVSHIRRHLSRYEMQITESAYELAPRYSSNPLPSIIQAYLADLEKPGFWPGAECVLAASAVLDTGVTVFSDDSTAHVIQADPLRPP